MSAISPFRPAAAGAATISPASRWGEAVRFGLGSVLAFRIAAEAVVLLGLYGLAAARAVAADPGALTRPWAQWDARWQLAIAQSGYLPLARVDQGTHVLSSAAFQPVLPGLMHVVAAATGVSVLVAGLVVTTAALGLAAVGLHRLVELDHGVRAARLAIVLLLAFPAAVFLGAPYAEPLVLAEAVWAFIAVRSGRPLIAGMLVGLAALTKLYAIVFTVPLAVEAVTVSAAAGWVRRRSIAAVVAGPLLGLAGLVVFYWSVFGDPLRFLSAQQEWVGRHLAPPWVALAGALSPPPSLTAADAAAVLDIACLALLVAATVYAWRHLRRSYAVLLGVQLAVFTSTTTLVGTSRWTLDAFPLFVAGGVLAARSRRLAALLLAVSVPAAGLFVWIYSHGGWAG